MLFRVLLPLVFLWVGCSSLAFGYEDSKVMPANIRRLTYRFVSANIAEKTNGDFSAVPLSRPLNKALTFNDILKGEKDAVRNSLTAGFLSSEGFNLKDSVGQFAADVKTSVQVSAPIFALGVSPTTTVAVALPVYKMTTAAAVSFQANDMGQAFINALSSDYNNQSSSARDAVAKLNDAVSRLNSKLENNGFQPLQTWSATGLGDAQLIVKNRTFERNGFALATQGVVTAPTGRIDDPDNLLDKGFGDGQWDLALGATAEHSLQKVWEGLSFSQYARWTSQLEGRRTFRLVTAEESIEVPKQRLTFNLGDRLETGAAALLSLSSGWGGALGYNYAHKGSDDFRAPAETRNVLGQNSFETLHQAEAEIAFSGVPAFRRGSIPVPFEVKIAYKRQLASRNMPVAHFLQIDTGVFF
jgi:uncharacterized protein YukE